MHFVRLTQDSRIAINSRYFESGIVMVNVSESISMPRYVIRVDGPTSFSGAKGIPRFLNTCCASMKSSFPWISVGATKKKSSE